MKKSPLIPIFFIIAVDILGFTLMIPILPFYAREFGASPTVVGMLLTSYALFQFLAGPILGRISDRIGRKPVLVFSQIGTFFGFLLLAGAQSLPIVFLSRIIDGATAGNISVAQAHISDVTPPDKRTRGFAIIGIAFGLGFLLGPAISGYLYRYGHRAPIYASAALSLTSIVLTLLLLPATPPKPEAKPDARESRFKKLSASFAHPKIGPILIQFSLFFLAFGLFISGFPLFAEQRLRTESGQPWGPTEVGYAYAFSGVFGLLIQGGAVARLAKRFGDTVVARSGFAAFMVGYAVLAFSSSWNLLLLAIPICAYGSSVIRPTLTSLLTQAADARDQGMILGISASLNALASIVTPLIAGVLIEAHLLTAWGLLMAGLAGLALLVKVKSQPSL